MRIGDAVWEWARRTPSAPAVVVPGGPSLTYFALERAAVSHAAGLAGHPAESPVPVLAESALEYLVQFLGTMRAGRVALCLPDQLPAGRFGALPLDPADLFYLGLTSGSTGEPKGILRTHASWLRSFDLMTDLFGHPGRMAVPGALVFSAALIAVLHTLHTGGTAVLVPGAVSLALLERERITSAFLVPARLRGLLDREGDAISDLPVTITTAGAKLDPDTRSSMHRLLPNGRIFEYYGSAEMGFVSYTDGSEPPASVGRLCPGVDLALRDEAGRPANPGAIHVRSPYQFAGYAGGAPLASSAWVTVGDWGRLDPAGCLYLLGRREEQINVGGAKVFAAEVEAALKALPSVTDAAVVALPDRLRGQVAGALVVGSVTAGAVRRWCVEHLPRHAVPRRVRLVDAIPRNVGGKVDREAAANLLSKE